MPGQIFGAQPGGQMGGGGAVVGVQSQRGPSVGSVQSIVQSTSGVPSSGQSQPAQVCSNQLQTSQGHITASTVHNPSPQDMSKHLHLQTSQPSMQQVYVHNPNRSGSQVNSFSNFHIYHLEIHS